MSYRGKKILFIFLTVLFGALTAIAVISTVGSGGSFVIPIPFGVLFIVFLIFAIIFRNKDQHYWPPKIKKPCQSVNTGDIIPWDLFVKISKAFPELPLTKRFEADPVLLDRLHLECRKCRISESSVRELAESMWNHIGLNTGMPDIDLRTTLNPYVTNGVAGEAHLDGRRSVLVEFRRGYTPDTIMTILAHEFAHFYQADKGHLFPGPYGELATDALTAFFGFGAIFLAGRQTYYIERNVGATTTTVNTVGYISDEDYKRILRIIDCRDFDPFDDSLKLNALLNRLSILRSLFPVRRQEAETFARFGRAIDGLADACNEYLNLTRPNEIKRIENLLSLFEEGNASEIDLQSAMDFFVKEEFLSARIASLSKI